jgi:hypothetical protein
LPALIARLVITRGYSRARLDDVSEVTVLVAMWEPIESAPFERDLEVAVN